MRGAQGEDLTHFVSKVRSKQQQQLDHRSPVTFTAIGCLAGLQVVFRLHESFQSPIRELTVPPYELTEVGWGEFDIAVTVGAWGLLKLGCRLGCVWRHMAWHGSAGAFF